MIRQRQRVRREVRHRRLGLRVARAGAAEAAVVVGDGVEGLRTRPRERPRLAAKIAAGSRDEQQRRARAGALVADVGVCEVRDQPSTRPISASVVRPLRTFVMPSSRSSVMPSSMARRRSSCVARAGDDHLADRVRDAHDLVDADAPVVAGLAAARAARRVVDLELLELGAVDVRAGDRHRLAAGLAELAREALRDHAVDRRGDEVGLHAHVDEPHRRAGGVVGVQRREHEMAGQGGVDRHVRAVAVAHLSDHDHVGVGAQDRTQAGAEGQPHALGDLDLVDALEAVLDGVLDRHQRLLGRADEVDDRVERRRLAGARRAGREDAAVREAQRRLEALHVLRAHPQLVERERGLAGVEDPQHRRLALHQRHHGDANVDVAVLEVEADAAVLRQAPLGDVQLAHDLDSRDHGRGLAARHARRVRHHAVDAVADGERPVVEGVEVHVGGAAIDGLRDDRAHEADRRSVVGRLADDDLLDVVRHPRCSRRRAR